jgi:FAD synthetase
MARIVMTFGTFDLLHPGHLYYLSEAKKLWDYLITVVARDETVESVKWKQPRENENIRLKKLTNSGLVDKVLLGSLTDHFAMILEMKPDILCFGYDQRSFNDDRLSQYLKWHQFNPQIVILPSFKPEKWKSSRL